MAYEQLKLKNQVCFRLYTASRLIIQAYEPFFKQLGITYTQYLVLMVLWEQDNQPVNDIAKKLVLETNTVTPLIQRMEKLDLVVRTVGPVDHRQKIVSLTKKGKTMQDECKDFPGCLINIFNTYDISMDELMALSEQLDRFINPILDHRKSEVAEENTK
uniref:MarR family transcriptional regulator n=5 Tax=unclassified Prevotella TaxID=2638335 RepID=A0AB33JH28_9BACT